MNVRQLCTRSVITVQESSTVADVAQLMCAEHVGAIVVVGTRDNRTQAIGIITDRDIVRAQLQRTVDLSGLAAFDIMTGDPLVLDADTDFKDALDKMLMRGVRRAPVIDGQGVPVGLISMDDLLAQLARELGGLARLLAMQPTIEGLIASRT
jgi:CBS domain-containing protein